jgi:hypothetical protein
MLLAKTQFVSTSATIFASLLLAAKPHIVDSADGRRYHPNF